MTEVDRVTLSVPRLPERPYLGSGCCVVLARELIADELRSWPGVHAVDVDDRDGRIELTVERDRRFLQDMLEAVEDLGYPPTVT